MDIMEMYIVVMVSAEFILLLFLVLVANMRLNLVIKEIEKLKKIALR